VRTLAVLGLLGLGGCQYVFGIHEFPVPALIGDPDGDFDDDGIPNRDDPCPHLDNSLPGGHIDQDGDGVPDLCDPNPTSPGDCLQLFDDFGAPTLSPLWQYDGNPITVVRNDPIFQNKAYLQFDYADEEVVYLNKDLDLDAVWVKIYVQAGDNPAAGPHAIELYVDLAHTPRGHVDGHACAVESSNGTGAVKYIHTVDGVDATMASSATAMEPLRVGDGNNFIVEWGTDAPATCLASTDPTDPSVTYTVDAPVPPSSMFAIRGLGVGLYILGVVGWGHNCSN
jgi:hypothetical protein